MGDKEEEIIARTIAEGCQTATVVIPCNCDNVKTAFECVKSAKSSQAKIELPVSTVQMEYTYHAKAPKMLDMIAKSIECAKQNFDSVEFVAKDATRADQDFVIDCAKIAYEKGASAITLCDDAGVFFPNEFASLVRAVKESCDIKVYVAPSNKIQMSASTAVECIKAGADGIITAIGCGEFLSPDVLAQILRIKGGELKISANLDVTAVNKTVQSVLDVAKKGDVSAEQNVYKDSLTLNADCTITDIQKETEALGYELSIEDVSKVYQEFKRVCERKGGSIGERELDAIIASTAMQVPSTFHLGNYVVNSGNIITATANVTLEKDGEELSGVSVGDGPIDAAFHAIEQIVGHHYELDDFNVQAVTKGREAVGSAVIRLRANGKLYSGNGVSTDIVGACIRAYINALNKIVYAEN
jgi:2-isopropylmalate synthase